MIALDGARKSDQPATLKNAVRVAQAWLSWFRRQFRSSEVAQIVACAVSGSAVGVLVAAVRRAIDFLHSLSFRLAPGHSLSAGIGVDPLRILIVPAIGGLALGLAALIVQRYRKPEIVDPIEANALHGGRMSMIDSVRLFIATIVSNAAGASVGMEAGYSQFGASAFSSLGQYFTLRRADQRTFVTAGAAAAIAAAFNAPLAGAFYGFELIQGNYAIRALAPVGAASLAAVLTERALINPEPLFVVGQVFHFKQSLYLLFALLGFLSAGFSVLAMQAVTWAERGMRAMPLPAFLRPVFGGLVLTMIALLIPQVLGSGHGAIQFQFDHSWALAPLTALLLAKLAASAISIGSGYRGGMFSSALFLGCLFGAAFADLSAAIIPRLGAQHAALMMVGMGSVAAAVVGAPLTMVFLVLEGTGDFPMTAGVMVAVVIASAVVRLTFGYSFSTWRFHQRGISIRSPHDVGWIAEMTVGRLMRSDASLVKASVPIGEARLTHPPGSVKHLFVVDDEGLYLGTLDLNTLHDREIDSSDPIVVGDMAFDRTHFLVRDNNVRSALLRFEDWQVEALPVLESKLHRVVVGYLTEAYALRRYSQELERRRSAELGEQNPFPIAEPPE